MKKLFNKQYSNKLIAEMVQANLSCASAGNLIAPSIMTYALYSVVPHVYLFILLALNIFVFLFRVLLQKHIPDNLTRHFFILAFASTLIAIYAWLSFIYGGAIYLLFIGIVITSLVAGSVTTLVSVYHVFAVFVTIQMLGVITALLAYGNEIFYLAAMMVSGFLYIVLSNGYKQYTNLKKMSQLNSQINDLLDNTEQGFLIFNEDLICEAGFSKECEHIFDTTNIEGSEITSLLFRDNEHDKEQFLDGISRLIKIENTPIEDLSPSLLPIENSKNIFLSLLPKEQVIKSTTVTIEYKILKHNRFLLILTDITKTRMLKSKLEKQSQLNKMIVEVISDKNDFIEIKNSFSEMLSSLDTYEIEHKDARKNLLLELHTFKGIFLQKEMLYTPTAIYDIEKMIEDRHTAKDIIFIIKDSYLDYYFEIDLQMINSVLGDEALSFSKNINIDISNIDSLEKKILSLVESTISIDTKQVDEILKDVKRMKFESLKHMLRPNISYAKQLSHKLNKDIYELEIEGDHNIKVSPRFKPFIKSLVHLFNNCIDHGIEDKEIRVDANKDEVGRVTCNFHVLSDNLIIQIADDGSGIDTETLSKHAIDKGIATIEDVKKMSEEEKCKLIFTDSLTTKDKVSNISGFGIGMGAIKNYLDQLDGKFTIENNFGKGAKFTFYIPLHIKNNEYLYNKEKCNSIFESVSTQVETYIKDTLEIEVKSKKNIPAIIIQNNYAQINFLDDFIGSVIIVFSNDFRDQLNAKLIPDGFNEADKEWLIQELPNEVLNTIVGLSIQHFDKTFGEINITAPIHIENLHLNRSVKKSKNKFIQEFETDFGSLTCIVMEGERL
ncbi:ATP-binding protein [Sulfurimonas sp.]|nr:ATP-binding protein [Sulfurimonas sp.]